MKKKKIALITGITGQDGAYLAKLLLKKNYKVFGIKRRTSTINTSRIDDIYQEDTSNKKNNFILKYGDVTDPANINSLINEILPDEVYNLAAQSHVAVSFIIPEYTSNVTAIGTLRILETIKNLKNKKKIKYYQAGSSELFGLSRGKTQNEFTPFYPKSPYAVSKLFAHWTTKNYRESYKIFACNGILFNHESPIRGETFVTRKIIRALCKIKTNKQKLSHIQAAEKEINKLEAEIMFCLIKNPTFIHNFKAQLNDIGFSDEFFQKSLWKIQHQQLSNSTDIIKSISDQTIQKNPPLKNHLIYNDQNKEEMSRNLLLNRITTLNLAKNRLESLKDLKIKIKTQGSDSQNKGESFEMIQSEYLRAMGGSELIEDSILRERKFDTESLDVFKKGKRKAFQKK